MKFWTIPNFFDSFLRKYPNLRLVNLPLLSPIFRYINPTTQKSHLDQIAFWKERRVSARRCTHARRMYKSWKRLRRWRRRALRLTSYRIVVVRRLQRCRQIRAHAQRWKMRVSVIARVCVVWRQRSESLTIMAWRVQHRWTATTQACMLSSQSAKFTVALFGAHQTSILRWFLKKVL